MTTIVMNTLSGAVTEYDWTFQSLSPTRATGPNLYTLGGDTDDGDPITGQFLSGDQGGDHKLGLNSVYVAVQGDADSAGEVLVQGASASWAYPVQVRASGVSRAKAGRGISESYLAIGYRNVDGADFRIDRVDPEIIESKQRRL